MRPPAWPAGPYDVVYADPPWSYAFSRSRSRKIERQYHTMAIQDILRLPVRELAAEDAALYLWVPRPKLVEGMWALMSWGATYKSCRVWDKEIMGAGYWARDDAEILLIGTWGSMSPPEPSARPRAMIRERRGAASAKPAVVREQIARGLPGRRIELFARDIDFEGEQEPRFVEEWRPGWDAWGDEIAGRA